MDQRLNLKKYFELVIRSDKYDESERNIVGNWRIKGIYNRTADGRAEDKNNDNDCQNNKFNGIDEWNHFIEKKNNNKLSKNDISTISFINDFGVENLNNSEGLKYWKKEWCKHGSWWFFSAIEYFAAIKKMFSHLSIVNFKNKAIDPEGFDRPTRGRNTNPSAINRTFVLKFHLILKNEILYLEDYNSSRLEMVNLRDEIELKNNEIKELLKTIEDYDKDETLLKKKYEKIKNNFKKCEDNRKVLKKKIKQLLKKVDELKKDVGKRDDEIIQLTINNSVKLKI